ncbi:putative sodium/calcium exchanger membrane region [Helianthus debilis subsp. tardiflorus]
MSIAKGSFIIGRKCCMYLKQLSCEKGRRTLLALGNGAPDVFAFVAAVSAGNARTGFGAILLAGTFVPALVVGFVAIYAAPFAVAPTPFVRDVLFYLTTALFLFYVYLSVRYLCCRRLDLWWIGGGGGGRVKSGVGDRNVSVETESGNEGNMGEFEKRKAWSRIRHAFDKAFFLVKGVEATKFIISISVGHC